jgi:exodeoxyribonuclease-3
MKIVSWNVNGIRAIIKKGFIESVNEINPDILCLQETKAQENQVKEALFGIDSYKLYVNSAYRKGYSGTAILSRPEPISVQYDMAIEEHDKEGRVITAEYNDFFLVTVYTPNSGSELVRLDYRKKWDADFLKYVKNLENTKPVIICGDLNVAHQPIDLKNPKANYNKTAGYTQTEIDGFENLLKAGFVDTFRHFYPDTVKYSWWSYRFNSRAKNIGWRIDYFLVSESLLPRVKDSFILNEYEGSDHCPVGIILE